jgi:hypothetical protein
MNNHVLREEHIFAKTNEITIMNKFETALKKYLSVFVDQEMYFVNDVRNLELFANTPQNLKEEDIRTKVSAINNSDLRDLYIQDAMITHIHNLNIDNRLNSNDLSLVEDIATITVNGKTHHVLHFASAYCNYHKPDVFPIYSEQFHSFYKQYILENKLPLDPEKLTSYNVFTKALNHLNQELGVNEKMNYLQQRKFAWLYAESILKESNT